MKYIVRKIAMAILTIATAFCSVGCFEDGCGKYKMRTTNDGVYTYCYNKGSNSYQIAGELGDLPATLYVPAYYKGKPVSSMLYQQPSLGLNLYGLSMRGVETLYVPFGCNLYMQDAMRGSCPYVRGDECFVPQTVFVTSSLEENHYCMEYFSVMDFYIKNTNGNMYVSKYKYEAILDSYKAVLKELNEEGYYSKRDNCTLRVANTAYMFNYEGSPNNDHFFINDFEYGATIETTPYEPLRKGYTFGGWYKEPECVNAWNFETDTLPEEQTNEEGVVIYQEIKLYAKWIMK